MEELTDLTKADLVNARLALDKIYNVAITAPGANPMKLTDLCQEVIDMLGKAETMLGVVDGLARKVSRSIEGE
jgi:hypothetical protein